jgi:hypothetical protein
MLQAASKLVSPAITGAPDLWVGKCVLWLVSLSDEIARFGIKKPSNAEVVSRENCGVPIRQV